MRKRPDATGTDSRRPLTRTIALGSAAAVSIGVAALLFLTPNKPAPVVPAVLEGARYGTLTLELVPADSNVTLPDVEGPYRHGMRLPEGQYRVTVQREGYEQDARTVDVVGDTPVRIELRPLERKDHVGAHDHVRSQLEAIESEKWAERVGDFGFAMARSGESAHFRLAPASHLAHTVVAFCDSDCRDVNLHLYDADGIDHAADATHGPGVVGVEVLPGQWGVLHVEVTISSCDIEPCHVGFGAFVDPAARRRSDDDRTAHDDQLVSDVVDRWRAFESRLDGFHALRDAPEIESLRTGESDYHYVSLSDTASYKLAALCDRNCSDVDLVLRDLDGELVAEDTTADSLPTIDITPAVTGRYRLEVRMYSCETGRCFYGLMAWQRGESRAR